MAAEPLVLVSASSEATEALGEALGAALGPGAVVALDGELGAGKTCLVRGIARGLGVVGAATSPTFTLLHEHEPGPRGVPLLHFDAWMAGREASFLEDGGAELLGGAGVCVIEWADRVRAWLPASRLAIRLEHVSADRPDERRLRLEGLDGRGEPAGAFAGALEAARRAAEAEEGLRAGR